jgi:hypothetical protein
MRKGSHRGTTAIPMIAAAMASILFAASCQTAARAELYAAQPSVDVGEVRCGAPLAYRFVFTNRGTNRIEIMDVHTSCGCLSPRLSCRSLPPGEEGSLVLEVNTLSQASGHHSWPVRITYRDKDTERELTLQVTGTIITEISVQPTALTIFTDAAVEHAITLTDLRAHPLTVTAANASSSTLRTRIEQSPDPEGRRVWRIRVAVDGGCPQGRHEELIRICTSDATYAELHVPVTIVKQPRQRLTAAPNPVAFLAARGQPIPSRIVVVRDRAEEPVVLERVVPDDPALECRWAPGPGSAATVKLTLDAGQLTCTPWESSVRIYVQKPTAEVLTVPVEYSLEGEQTPK